MVKEAIFDEMHTEAGGVRPHYQAYAEWLAETPADSIVEKRNEADTLFRRAGITFAVYGDETGTERLIPFDIVPRIIPSPEWERLQQGLRQRVTALNAFLHDVYHDQEILRAGHIPAEQVLCNVQYRPEMQGIDLPMDVYAHIAGIDLVRAGKGEYYVLEDNLRVPSGVSYMLEDRKAMMRLFPELFARYSVSPVEHYPDLLLETLRGVAPAGVRDPVVVLLTPGAHNSAYFEHAFLAQQMGIELVEGQDLFVDDEIVYRAASMSSIDAWTMTFWIRWPFVPIPCSACRACSPLIVPDASSSLTRSARVSPMTSRPIRTSQRWFASISAKSPSCKTYRLGFCAAMKISSTCSPIYRSLSSKRFTVLAATAC
jgi:uncharacterized circularly permuted ATP-grasp superfamily protein